MHWRDAIIALFLILHLNVNVNGDVVHINNFPDGFEMLPTEDYPELMESNKPDDVDNEVIEKLVNEFLNKGSIEGTKKGNKDAQILVNSSSYWNVNDLQPPNSIKNNEIATKWLDGYAAEWEKVLRQVAMAGWNYFASASPITRDNLAEAEEVARKFLKISVQQARQFDVGAAFAGDDANARVQRAQMALILKQGTNALDDGNLDAYNSVLRRVNQLFTNTPICDVNASHNTPCIIKYSDFASVLQRTRNASDALRWWAGWRASAGENLTDAYAELVKISNKVASLNGYENIGAMWRSAYEDDEFKLNEQMEHCYKQFLPLYQQLHAYMRLRLAAIYNSDAKVTEIARAGALPIHLLKSSNGETWLGHYEQTKPYTDEAMMMMSMTHLSSSDNGVIPTAGLTGTSVGVEKVFSNGDENVAGRVPRDAFTPVPTPVPGIDFLATESVPTKKRATNNNPAAAETNHNNHGLSSNHQTEHSESHIIGAEVEPSPEPKPKSLSEPEPAMFLKSAAPQLAKMSDPQSSPNSMIDAAVFEDKSASMMTEPMLHISDKILNNLRAQNYTARTMFAKAYRYLKYLGFEPLPSTVWSKSIFSRNWSKDMICDPATAYDMINGSEESDIRIKVCAQLSDADFANAHRLLIQLYYKFLTRQKTILLRDSPNPSLTGALSSAFGVLALNPDYLKGIKMLDTETHPTESYTINRLYREALEQFVPLNFAIVADKWRYAVFEGQLSGENLSKEWWKLRYDYQGIKPPSAEALKTLMNERTEKSTAVFSESLIANVAKYDAVASPLIVQQHAPAARNFVSYVLQFQILKYLCPETPSNKLHEGCIPMKQKIQKITDAMSKGATVSWVDVMEEMTGSRKLDAAPLMEYYQPLMEWLQMANKNMTIGWTGEKNDEPFDESELPALSNTSEEEQRHFIPGDEQIAYPGQNCANGQECLLDSVCNGSICICREGLFTLRVADTYNCVPGNPANAGFADDSGGLVIALNPSNSTTNGTNLLNFNVEENSSSDVGNRDTHNQHHHHTASSALKPISLSCILKNSFFYFVFLAICSKLMF